MNQSPRRFLWLALLCALLAVLCLMPGLNGGFVLDDGHSILMNPFIQIRQLNAQSLLAAANSFNSGTRPLAMLSFGLDYWRGGMDASVFKATNLLIHALTVIVLALFLRRLLAVADWPPRRAAAGALALALLWGIHPLQVSSVLYVVQRMQTLCTLFMVLALWAYLAMRWAQKEGHRSRRYGLLMLLFWALGGASKEDAALLPLYTLALELTVLRFDAASPRLAAAWRKGYLFLSVAGVAVFLLVVAPHYWSWDAYPEREFSSYERLLTQGRVLVMYLGQIVLPLPDRLPFYYDGLAISRGLLQPLTTLPAWLLVLGLLAWAWQWRARRPLFALGVFLFFAGHFMTSNIINLELAFEHRNHFPLIGALLALADLCLMAWQRLALRPSVAVALAAAVFLALGAATARRAHVWGEPVRFAEEMLRLQPHSERAWAELSRVLINRSSAKAGDPWLDRAIATAEQGGAVTESAGLQANLVVYKTMRGDVSPADWTLLYARLARMKMTPGNQSIAMAMLADAQRSDWVLDGDGMTGMLEILTHRADYTSSQYLQMAVYIYNKTQHPEKALPFLRRAVESAPAGDPEIAQTLTKLRQAGREDWADELEQIRRTRKAP